MQQARPRYLSFGDDGYEETRGAAARGVAKAGWPLFRPRLPGGNHCSPQYVP
jgi:hypothetical protein